MPNNETLYSSCYGTIRYCPHRCQFRLYFGDMQVAMETETLRQFARKVARLADKIERSPITYSAQPTQLCPPNLEGRTFSFCLDEILDLNDLLSGSLTLIELNEFLTENGFTIRS
ncbi:hypothetical protein [Spirosoma agri]|uniref:Uncharacterized protein n=1 Tax=Spirosoma agri TaxID=1987381 RepID=A0A6M0IKM4_9BACT|nr:hypothetical protein [Spirosoma agri]NEU67493.1 hypothetical protein [Spirosoma agri]